MFKRTNKNGEKEFESKEEHSPAPFQPYRKTEERADIPPRVFPALGEDTKKTDWLHHSQDKFSLDKNSHLPHPLQSLVKQEEPETTLGEGVSFRGQLQFQRLLRIDGQFEGELISLGKLIVGPKGSIKSNIDLHEAVIEGSVEGNITVKGRLELRGEAKIFGDIRAKTLTVDEGVTLIGSVYVDPSQDLATPSFSEDVNCSETPTCNTFNSSSFSESEA